MEQWKWVVKRLREAPMTRLDAMREYGIQALNSRISDLRAKGYVIQTELINVTNRHGNECRVARYTLISEPCHSPQ